MHRIARLCLLSSVLTFTLPVLAVEAAPVAVHDCVKLGGPVAEDGFVPIGGIEQWVTVKGSNCNNPVMLFIHGGPGNPLSPWAQNIYGAWEKDFTLVQWDQRGAGFTFGRNPASAEAPLTLDQMTRDGIEVASYLARRFGQKSVILMGSSWGSVLAVHMTKAQPGLFTAYVGTSQMVSYRGNGETSYQRILGAAHAAGDGKTVATIEALGPPPWTNPRNFGIMRRASRVYEGKATTPAPKSWWVKAAQYATPKAEADYEAGEDYSFIRFVGMKGDGIYSTVNLPKLGTRFDVPVLLVQGEQDLITVPAVSRAWFDSLSAPRKEFVMVPMAGHDPNEAMVEAQYKLAKTLARPR